MGAAGSRRAAAAFAAAAPPVPSLVSSSSSAASSAVFFSPAPASPAPIVPETNVTALRCVLHEEVAITSADLAFLRDLGFICSTLGVCLCLPLLLLKLCIPKYRQFPSRISTIFVAACTLFHGNVILGFDQDWEQALYTVKVLGQPPSTFCVWQGVAFQFFASCMVWLWCEVSVVMYLVVVRRLPFEVLARQEKWFHAVWLGLSIVQTVCPALLTTYPAEPQLGAPYCWLSDEDNQLYQILFLHAEMLLVLLVGFSLCVAVLRKLGDISGGGGGGGTHGAGGNGRSSGVGDGRSSSGGAGTVGRSSVGTNFSNHRASFSYTAIDDSKRRRLGGGDDVLTDDDDDDDEDDDDHTLRDNDEGGSDFVAVIWGYVVRHALFAVAYAVVFVVIALFVANQMLANIDQWCVTYGMALLHVVAVSGTGVLTFAVLGPTRANARWVWNRFCKPVRGGGGGADGVGYLHGGGGGGGGGRSAVSSGGGSLQHGEDASSYVHHHHHQQPLRRADYSEMDDEGQDFGDRDFVYGDRERLRIGGSGSAGRMVHGSRDSGGPGFYASGGPAMTGTSLPALATPLLDDDSPTPSSQPSPMTAARNAEGELSRLEKEMLQARQGQSHFI